MSYLLSDDLHEAMQVNHTDMFKRLELMERRMNHKMNKITIADLPVHLKSFDDEVSWNIFLLLPFIRYIIPSVVIDLYNVPVSVGRNNFWIVVSSQKRHNDDGAVALNEMLINIKINFRIDDIVIKVGSDMRAEIWDFSHYPIKPQNWSRRRRF